MRIFKRIVLVFLLVCFIGYGYVYSQYAIPILAYHSISDAGIGTPVVNPKNFERQMEYLKKKKYNVISLTELVEGIVNKTKFPRNTVVITFDDGYKDNYIYAYPILKKYKIPVTIFLISSFIGRKPEHLTWREVIEMSKNNITFGAHTMAHVYLPEAASGIAWQQIKGAKDQIEANIGQNISLFCYPSGGFSEEIKKQVKEAGFKAACTTNRGFNKANQDIYELKRIKVTDKDGARLFKFRVKLSGYYDVFRSEKKPY